MDNFFETKEPVNMISNFGFDIHANLSLVDFGLVLYRLSFCFWVDLLNFSGHQ